MVDPIPEPQRMSTPGENRNEKNERGPEDKKKPNFLSDFIGRCLLECIIGLFGAVFLAMIDAFIRAVVMVFFIAGLCIPSLCKRDLPFSLCHSLIKT